MAIFRILGKGRAYVGLLAGLATLAAYRRQGIATAITSKAVEQAFEHGAEIVFLTAADDQSGRVYQKVGFENYTLVLAYVDSDDNSSSKNRTY